jgi:hypothetical protein
MELEYNPTELKKGLSTNSSRFIRLSYELRKPDTLLRLGVAFVLFILIALPLIQLFNVTIREDEEFIEIS